ncbi:MAG: hypothetical protein HY718_19550, partial [Planctomycetes bacterium]|nr:hypothetical protein [Planctomycetota bacterium]
MSTGRKLSRWVVVALVLGLGAASALAEMTAAEKLDKASQLFKAGQYEQSKALLLEIEPAQLNADQNRQRSELVDEVVVAINQSNKARRDLQDAEQALEAGQRPRAADLFGAVQKNPYASDDQKTRARNGLATIARQEQLESKLKGAQTQPAGVAQTRPSAAKQREARRQGPVPAPTPTDDRTLAEAAVRAGNEALAKGQLDTAEQRFQEALRISPNDPQAASGLDLVRQYRKAEGRPGLLSEEQQHRRAVAQRTEVLFRRNERDIRQAIADKQFDVAGERLDLARRMVETARRDFAPEQYNQLVRQLDSLGRFIDDEKRAYDATQAQIQRRTALDLEGKRRARDEKEREDRIGQLFEQVMQLQTELQYSKAADLLKEILLIDPTYEPAKFMLDNMDQAALIQKQTRDLRTARDKLAETIQEAESARIPNVTGAGEKIVAYPSEEEWRIIAERDPFGAGITGEDEIDRRSRERLRETAPPIDFPEGTGFEEVINWLREQSRLSVNVNWNALIVQGIDRTTDTLGIALENARFETIQKLLLDNVGGTEGQLDYDIVDGIVRISTREELDRNKITRVYDVSDLLIRIPSFRSQNEGLGGLG